MNEDHGMQMNVLNQAYGAVVEDRSKLQSAWRIDQKDLKWEKRLAAGSFGEVWKGNKSPKIRAQFRPSKG